MPASVVQSAAGNFSVTAPAVTLGATPTVGNTLLAVVASDTTSSAVPNVGSGRGYTQRLAQVNNQGFYVWTRLVTSGDTATTTFTMSAASPATAAVLEIFGTWDKTGTGTTTINSGSTSVAPAGLVPTTADGITVGIAGLHSVNVLSAPTAAPATWSVQVGQFSPTAGTTLTGLILASLVTTSTASTGAVTLGWSGGNANDRDGVQIAFTGIAVAAANPLPDLHMAPRR